MRIKELTISKSHKYQVGAVVQFVPATYEPSATRGRYTVLRQLPTEREEYQYRVRSAVDGRERMVRESQLTLGTELVTEPWMAVAPARSR